MIRRSERALGTVFYVPNDKEGQAFIRNMRRFLNRSMYKVRIRGRNENRKQFRINRSVGSLQEFIPLALASYFAVYIDSPGCDAVLDESRRRHWKELSEARNALADARQALHVVEGMRDFERERLAEITRVQAKLDTLMLEFGPRKIYLE